MDDGRTPKLEVFEDAGGEWRWRLKGGNGEIVADSAEGYTRKADAVTAAWRSRSLFLEAKLEYPPDGG